MDLEERYGEDFNQPEWIQVDMTYMQNLEENLEYYKTFVKMIEEEIDEFEGDTQELADNIEEYLKELKGVLH
jgi:septal ring factor EnvC (AmiA/AmiB activator)